MTFKPFPHFTQPSEITSLDDPSVFRLSCNKIIESLTKLVKISTTNQIIRPCRKNPPINVGITMVG